jgi:ADP-ribosylation factor 2-binding protein
MVSMSLLKLKGTQELCLGGDDEELFEIVDRGHKNEGDDEFDEVVGCLQEILMDPSFDKMQRDFCNRHCMKFDASEENKLIYMSVFKEYTDLMEHFINQKLTEAIPGFSMDRFMGQLKERKDEIDETLMDLLLSLSEFESFKEMMLFARAHFVATTPKPRSGKAVALGLKDSLPSST